MKNTNQFTDEEGNVQSFTKESNSSIMVSRGSKGGYAWDIKIYWDESEDQEESKVISRIKTINEELKKTFFSQE